MRHVIELAVLAFELMFVSAVYCAKHSSAVYCDPAGHHQSRWQAVGRVGCGRSQLFMAWFGCEQTQPASYTSLALMFRGTDLIYCILICHACVLLGFGEKGCVMAV